MRSQLPRFLFALVSGAAGIGLLLYLTDSRALVSVALPLAFFTVLSLIVKRAGVYAALDTLHSLVGIVDLAAVFIFGPVLGAWVPAVSSFLFVFTRTPMHRRAGLGTLVESAFSGAGLKALMGVATGTVYAALGGPIPPRELGLATAIPAGAAVLTWYVLDNLAWAASEILTVGWSRFYRLFRDTLGYSILVELIPLPFATVIALVYTVFGGITRPIFLLMAAALIEVAFVVHRLADAQEHLERRRQELMGLNDFSQALSRAGFDTDRIVELILQYASRISLGDCYALDLLNAEGDRVRVHVESRGGKLAWDRTESVPSPAVAYLRDNPASIQVADLAVDKLPFKEDELINGRPARSAIYLPLLSREQVIGLLTVLAVEPDRLRRNAARNLSSIAIQAGIALENASLYAVERRRANQLALVSEVSRRVAQFLDLDELLQRVVLEIRDRFGYSHVHIFARNENNDLVFRASTHPDLESWRQSERIPSGTGIVGWVLQTGEPLLAPDVSKEPRYLVGPGTGLANTRSELAVPLTVGGKVLGVLDVQSEEPNRFGEEDLFVLRTLAAQIAIAIEDARLYAAQKEESWYLNVLLQVAENLADAATLDDALETVVRITPILVGVARCAVFLYDPAEHMLRAAKEYGIKPELKDRFLDLSFKVEPEEIAAMNRVIDSELVARFGFESLLMTPLLYHSSLVGAMAVDQGQRRFSPHEVEIVMGIANQAAVAIENARLNEQAEIKKRLDYEIGLARRIQTSFLPPCCPQVPGYQLSAAWRAAREVSGDFYDFLSWPDGRFGFTIADVSDKGMPAALFMVLTRTLIRAMAIGKPTPKEALERANDLILSDSQADMFATAFYGILDTPTGLFSYANAGHNAPLLYRRAGEELVELKDHGMALGLRPGISLPGASVELAPGDILVLYTDGITDALNPEEEEFGTPRLADLIAANNHLCADDLVEEILKAVYEFGRGVPQFDDMTLVVLERDVDGKETDGRK